MRWHWATFSALVDHRGGFEQLDLGRWEHCATLLCRASEDRSTPPGDQASATLILSDTFAGYIEDAGFWKLRELSVRLDAPARWAHQIGARELAFTVAGRNLLTITSYRGLDPEVSLYGINALAQADAFTPPPVRSVITRLDVTW